MKRGYSLLVVIIALVIFATGILSVVSLMPSGQKAVNRTIFYNRAATIAERELALIRVRYSEQDSPIPPEEISGEEPDGFRWSAVIREENGVYSVTLLVYSRDKKEKPEIFETKFIRK